MWGVNFRKIIAKCITPFYQTLWNPFYKMAAISKVIRLSQDLRGTEPPMLTLCIGFVGRRWKTTEESGRVTWAGQEETREAKTEMGGLCKERCEEDRRGGRLEEEDRRQRRVEKNSRWGGEKGCRQHLTPDKGKKRKRERFQKKYCQIHHAIIPAILEAIFQKNGGLFQSNRSYLWTQETDNHHSGVYVYHFSRILFR